MIEIQNRRFFKNFQQIIFVSFVIILFAPFAFAGKPVFPGAQGFGTETRAAYGLAPGVYPKIYKVTSLSANPTVSGTLGHALIQSGPRVIVFEIAGTIDGPAAGIYDYKIDDPYVTVAGQTAPAPGITLKGINLKIRTHDVLIQHLRIRLGDMREPGEGASWLENRDCISITNPKDTNVYNIVIDHCSVSWSMDENIEIWPNSGGKIYNVTVSNSIISEGLANSVRCDVVGDCGPKGHSKGLIVGFLPTPFACTNISIVRNLFAHNYDRNPVNYDSKSVVVNNLVYNPGDSGPHFSAERNPVETAAVGNVVIPGIDSKEYSDYAISIGSHSWSPWVFGGRGSKIYAADNDCEMCGVNPWDGVDDRGKLESTVKVTNPPIWPAGLVALVRTQVRPFVLSNAGARPSERDRIDQRVVSDVTARTGSIIDSQNDVGGWPKLSENSHSFILPSNPHGDNDGDGYTNLEEMIHMFAKELEGPSGPSLKELSPPLKELSPPTGLKISLLHESN